VTAEGARQQRGATGLTPLDQAFDAGSLYALRAAVAAHAAAAGLGRHQVYDVTAVAHELAANAVVHGAGRGRLRLWSDDKFLYCQVSDDGRGGAVDEAGGPDGAASWPAEHGHGLWLAGQIADQLSISHGPAGTTATVRFPLSAG
jgi:anti-sigma regulatory factor (Ser/Thr protein kinase)